MRVRSSFCLGLGLVAGGIVVGACTFPDVDTLDATGGGAAGSGTTLAGPGPGSTTAISSGSNGGGSTSGSSSGSDGGGGTGTSGELGGGGSTGGNGGGGSGPTLTGVGGGVVDVACDNGCVPFPDDGLGGAGGGVGGAGGRGVGGAGGAADDDCDDDGDPNHLDCQPCDPLVFHDQVEFFEDPFVAFEPEAEASYDYDCSGGKTVEYPYVPDGCSGVATNVCGDSPIFTGGDAPVCGESTFVQECTEVGVVITSCDIDGNGTNMRVRCH